jgi:hypothetical protein
MKTVEVLNQVLPGELNQDKDNLMEYQEKSVLFQ